MPKLPDATALGPRPVARSTAGYRAPADTTIVGKAVAGLGKTLENIDDKLDEYDKMRAEDAYNKLIKKKIDLTRGENGFMSRRGTDAANGKLLEEYGGGLDKFANTLSSELANDRQRKYLQKRASIAKLQMRNDVLGHVMTENNALASQTFKSTLNIELTNAVDSYQDPMSVAVSKKRMDVAINDEARRLGWSAQEKKDQKALTYSAMHSGIIDRMLVGDNDIQAEEYFKKNQKEFTKKDKISVLAKLDISSTRGKAMRAADKIVAQTRGDLKQALLKARDIKRPKVREATINNIKSMITEDEAAINLNKDEAFTNAFQVVQETGSVQNIEPKYQVELSPVAMGMLDKVEKEQRENTTPTHDEGVYQKFNQVSRNRDTLAKMSDTEFFTNYWQHFDTSHRERAISLREAAKSSMSGDKTSTLKMEEHISFEQRAFDTLERLNIIKPTNTKTGEKELSPEDRLLIGDFREEVDRRIREVQRASGDKFIDGDTKQQIMNDVALEKFFKVNVDRWYWDEKGVPVGQLTPEQRKEAYVPIENIRPGILENMYNFSKGRGIIQRSMSYDDFVDHYEDRIQRAMYMDLQGATADNIEKVMRGR